MVEFVKVAQKRSSVSSASTSNVLIDKTTKPLMEVKKLPMVTTTNLAIEEIQNLNAGGGG